MALVCSPRNVAPCVTCIAYGNAVTVVVGNARYAVLPLLANDHQRKHACAGAAVASCLSQGRLCSRALTMRWRDVDMFC